MLQILNIMERIRGTIGYINGTTKPFIYVYMVGILIATICMEDKWNEKKKYYS